MISFDLKDDKDILFILLQNRITMEKFSKYELKYIIKTLKLYYKNHT